MYLPSYARKAFSSALFLSALAATSLSNTAHANLLDDYVELTTSCFPRSFFGSAVSSDPENAPEGSSGNSQLRGYARLNTAGKAAFWGEHAAGGLLVGSLVTTGILFGGPRTPPAGNNTNVQKAGFGFGFDRGFNLNPEIPSTSVTALNASSSTGTPFIALNNASSVPTAFDDQITEGGNQVIGSISTEQPEWMQTIETTSVNQPSTTETPEDILSTTAPTLLDTTSTTTGTTTSSLSTTPGTIASATTTTGEFICGTPIKNDEWFCDRSGEPHCPTYGQDNAAGWTIQARPSPSNPVQCVSENS